MTSEKLMTELCYMSTIKTWFYQRKIPHIRKQLREAIAELRKIRS